MKSSKLIVSTNSFIHKLEKKPLESVKTTEHFYYLNSNQFLARVLHSNYFSKKDLFLKKNLKICHFTFEAVV